MKQQGLSDKSGNYPRTGKRGVPQQFPRKLFEMLDLESNNFKSGCVSWSNDGRAFRIADVDVFSEEILPVYFKTSKFSSFQRNLHLYGFAKIDKGRYSHPKFRRGDIEGLSQLRKRVKEASRPIKITPPSSPTQEMDNIPFHQHHDSLSLLARVAMVLEASSHVCMENTFYC